MVETSRRAMWSFILTLPIPLRACVPPAGWPLPLCALCLVSLAPCRSGLLGGLLGRFATHIPAAVNSNSLAQCVPFPAGFGARIFPFALSTSPHTSQLYLTPTKTLVPSRQSPLFHTHFTSHHIPHNGFQNPFQEHSLSIGPSGCRSSRSAAHLHCCRPRSRPCWCRLRLQACSCSQAAGSRCQDH